MKELSDNLNLSEVQEPENRRRDRRPAQEAEGRAEPEGHHPAYGHLQLLPVSIGAGRSKTGPQRAQGLAETYNVDLRHMLKRAGYGPKPDPNSNEVLEVERAYRYVLADPVFRVGTRPDGPLSISAKRFIVEMYERFTNRKLLQ